MHLWGDRAAQLLVSSRKTGRVVEEISWARRFSASDCNSHKFMGSLGHNWLNGGMVNSILTTYSSLEKILCSGKSPAVEFFTG